MNKIQEVLVSEIDELEKIKSGAKKEEDDDSDDEDDDDEEEQKDSKPISEEKVDDELSEFL